MGQAKSKYSTYQDDDWPYVWALRDPSFLDWKTPVRDDKTLMAFMQAQNDVPVEIMPTLYLGNCQYIHDLDILNHRGIHRVLNMAGDMKTGSQLPLDEALHEHGIAYKWIRAEDEEEYPLLDRHWEEAHAFLQDANDKEETVLVHCVAGHNRSALIVAAEYMVRTKTSVIETVRHIRETRGNVALQNEGFQEQLVAFARHHNLLDDDAPTPLCRRVPRTKRTNPLDQLAV